MTEPAEIVTTLFSAVVGILIIYTLVQVSTGKDITGIIDLVSSAAVPFMVGLIIIFVLLSVITES